MATVKAFKPSKDQVKLIVLGLKALSDINRRAAKAAKVDAVAELYEAESVKIDSLVNDVTTSELEF